MVEKVGSWPHYLPMEGLTLTPPDDAGVEFERKRQDQVAQVAQWACTTSIGSNRAETLSLGQQLAYATTFDGNLLILACVRTLAD